MAINEKELNEVSGEQHQEPRPHLHQPEADHLSDHPSLSDRQHQSPASRRGIFVVMLPVSLCRARQEMPTAPSQSTAGAYKRVG